MYVEPLRVVLQKDDFKMLMSGQTIELKINDGKIIELVSESRRKYKVASNGYGAEMPAQDSKSEYGKLSDKIREILIQAKKPLLSTEITEKLGGRPRTLFGSITRLRKQGEISATPTKIKSQAGRFLLAYAYTGKDK